MARLIEVQDAQQCPSVVTVHAGDVLLFHATGGRIRSGGDAVEMMPPLLSAVLGDTGHVVAPIGAPNVVLLRTHAQGHATIDVVTGDPWQNPHTTTLGITVEP